MLTTLVYPIPSEKCMFGFGFPELLLIMAIALVVIGPKRLPDLARALGRGFAEFKRATDELKTSFVEESRTAQSREELLKAGKLTPPGSTPSSPYDQESPPEASAPELSGVNPAPRVPKQPETLLAEAEKRDE